MIDYLLDKGNELFEFADISGGRQHFLERGALLRPQRLPRGARIAHGLLRISDQALVQGLFVVFPAGVVDAVEEMLGRAAVVVKSAAQPLEIALYPLQDARKHPVPVPQLMRIRGMMYIRLHSRRVNADAFPVLDAPGAGVLDDSGVYRLPRGGANPLYVLLQRLERGHIFIVHETKCPKADGIGDTALKVAVTQPLLHLHNGKTDNLLCGHPLCTRRLLGLAVGVPAEIVPRQNVDRRIGVQYGAYHLPLLRVRRQTLVECPRTLALGNQAHVTIPFLWRFRILLVTLKGLSMTSISETPHFVKENLAQPTSIQALMKCRTETNLGAGKK